MFNNQLITITNIQTKETVTYSLPLIKGYVTPCVDNPNCNLGDELFITLRRLSDNLTTRWPVVNGNFKCLAELKPGINIFSLDYLNSVLTLELTLRSTGSPYHVLPVYIITADHDGQFQGPEGEDCSTLSAQRRISLGSKLIQTVTAEKLVESDLGRRTFQLAQDVDSSLRCLVFRSVLSSQQVYNMESEEIWEHFGRELMSSKYGREDRKFLAFLACTRYNVDMERGGLRVRGHVALGGGGLALFGTGCLHTWPENIQDVVSRFNDATKIDTTRFMDDSCYRGTQGSCFSTTLGAVCHELGHAFDLGHSRKGIMARGFDNISLVFTVDRDNNRNVITRTEAQHATVSFTRDLNITYKVDNLPNNQNLRKIEFPRRPKAIARTPSPPFVSTRTTCLGKIPVDDLTFWDKSCAVLLRYHKWFLDPELDYSDDNKTPIEFDPTRRMITAAAGLRVIEIRGEDGLVLTSWEFLSTWVPKQFVLSMNNKEMEEGKTVVAEDSAGNLIKELILTG